MQPIVYLAGDAMRVPVGMRDLQWLHLSHVGGLWTQQAEWHKDFFCAVVQIADYVSMVDQEIPGYVCPQVVTSIHLNFERSAILYR